MIEVRRGGVKAADRVGDAVLCPSSEAYDRGEKFRRYMRAESLGESVGIDQHATGVDVFYRQAGGTRLMAPYVGRDAVVRLRSLGLDLPLTEVYFNVVLPLPAEGDVLPTDGVDSEAGRL